MRVVGEAIAFPIGQVVGRSRSQRYDILAIEPRSVYFLFKKFSKVDCIVLVPSDRFQVALLEDSHALHLHIASA